MGWEDSLFDVFLAVLPALVVFLTAYFLLKKFFQERAGMDMLELKKSTSAGVLPNRLQAFERMALFLERISPENMVMRIQKPGMSASLLHSHLLQTVRTEYEHNMAQQVYISIATWDKIKQSKEECVQLINVARSKIGNNATSVDLTKMIFGIQDQVGKSPTTDAMIALKNDMKRFF